MDFGLFMTCLFFGILFDNIALEKAKSSRTNLDRLIPLIFKPALITDKQVNNDYSLKAGTTLPTGGDNVSEANKTTQDLYENKKPKETENKKNNKSAFLEYDADCPDCDSKDNSDIKEHFHEKPELNNEQKPIDKKKDNVRNVIEMKIERPYIIHNDHVTKNKTKTSDKLDFVIPNYSLGALVKPNGNIERQNDNKIGKRPNDISFKAQNTVSVKTAPALDSPTPKHNLVKIENDYHMKEYKEFYAPYYRYNSNYPLYQNYCDNQNGYNLNNNGYNNNQNNGYRCNQNNGYSYNQNGVGYQKPLSKVWRTVFYSTRKNGEIVNQKFSTYIPVFHNNCYNPGTEQIGGYAYYFNHNVY